MKKIFTLILMAATLMPQAFAQFDFVRDGEVIPDGGETTFYAELVEVVPGFNLLECAPDAPFIKNTGDNEIELTVQVKKTNPEVDDLTWCGITMQCAPIKGGSETRQTTLAAGAETMLALHANFKEGNYATYRAEVTATDGDAVKTIYINFVYNETAGIDAAPSASSIRYANGALNYSFDSAARRTLSVYDAQGRLVKKTELSANGSLSLSGLPSGVYLYALTANGHRATAAKFIVK